MNPLISNIIRRLKMTALISTLVVFYPNIVCLAVDIAKAESIVSLPIISLTIYSLVKFAMFWAMFIVLIKKNMSSTTLTLRKRLLCNIVIIIPVYVVNLAVFFLFKPYGAREDIGSVLVFQYIITCFLCTALGHFVRLYIEGRQKEIEIERLKAENLQSRYDALTNQINPHFLFNALGGISALVRLGHANQTLHYVDELSDIFRYILQSERKGMVTLEEELHFVGAFRYIMEVRFADKISFDIHIDEQAKRYSLPVLSLLPLIDNVVVHNQIDSDHKMCISISLNADEELVVANPIYPRLSPARSNGTGLRNLENRYMLLVGKGIRHGRKDNCFTVYLPLTKS